MQHIPHGSGHPTPPHSLSGSPKYPRISSHKISDSLRLKAVAGLPISLVTIDPAGPQIVRLPAEPVDRESKKTPAGVVTIQSTSRHRLDAARRWGDARELKGQIGRQQSSCIVIDEGSRVQGFIIPTMLYDGATLVAVSWSKTDKSPTFSLYEFRKDRFISLPAETPKETAGVMHATQNLSHINEGLKILKAASSTAIADVSLVVPSVERSEMLTRKLPATAAEKVSGWTYLEDGNKNFTTDFSSPSSMESIVGFLGCNLELARRVRAGEFKVLASDFRAEPQILALLNPGVVLAGFNYTFLSGRPGEYAARMGEHPLRALLEDTASSLDAFGAKLSAERETDTSCDWWDLTNKKLGAESRRLDVLAYRTLRYDPDLPRSINGIPVIQVPHPVAPLTISRAEARRALADELKFDPETSKVVVVPGLSDDGQFERRLQALARIALQDPTIIMVSPLESAALAKICGVAEATPRIHGIGFREKWGEVLVASDAAIIRGSWGEILDCIRAGVVPIFNSPGIIEQGRPRPQELFLQEVLGERAMNLALLFEALEKERIPQSLLEGLIVGANNNDSALRNAIQRATESGMNLAVQTAFKGIRRDGVERLVDVYAWLQKLGRKPGLNEVESFERRLWEKV